MNIGSQVRVIDGAFMGYTGIITAFDGDWAQLKLRDGSYIWLALSNCRLAD